MPFRKRRAGSESSDPSSDVESPRPFLVDLSGIDHCDCELVEEATLTITIAVEGAMPWHEIDIQIYNEKGSLQDYLNECNVLKGLSGYKLLMADFDQLYPATGADDTLRASLQNVAGSIITKAKIVQNTTTDQCLKLALTELLTSSLDGDLENTLAISLLLLPLLMNITPLKGKGVKTSKTLIRDNFIIRVSSTSNLEAQLADQRKTLRALNITFQPIVVYIGEYVASVEKCYVIVEDMRYELPSIVAAVDNTFEIFHATATEYPY